tara:strand:+ start:1096 stop:1560 length:465 start_codon:yes stop_codon:yes gene_type:complete
MLKNYLSIILFIFTASCGYEAIYSKKNRIINADFSITEIYLNGDRNLNIQIKKRLNNYNRIGKARNYILNIKTRVNKIIVAKDSKGDPSIYELQVAVVVTTKTEDNKNIEIQFNESFKYNNIQDKFELAQSENEIKNNLAETIVRRLISELKNF